MGHSERELYESEILRLTEEKKALQARVDEVSARVLEISRLLNAHLNQPSRNRVCESMAQLRGQALAVMNAMDQGTLDVPAISEALKGMAELATDTERELRAAVAEDNRTVEGA